MLEGEVEFLLGEDTIPAGAGSCVYVPRGTLHTFKNVGTSPSRVLAFLRACLVRFTPPLLDA